VQQHRLKLKEQLSNTRPQQEDIYHLPEKLEDLREPEERDGMKSKRYAN